MANENQIKANTKSSGSRKQNRNTKVQEGKSSHENRGDETIPFPEEIDISPYVSNVDGPVYAISGLPEEFIATLFAWVSRSPKSFKEHLKAALKEHNMKASIDSFKELNDKAKAFHEKWTVGYGHSSVAEHATAHVGIEGISRLASAELELSNTFLSITEYSQRYQRPQNGDWYNPVDRGNTKLYLEVHDFIYDAFVTYEKLVKGVHEYLINKESNKGNKTLSNKQVNELEKLAFEDARYVLPLAMHTQLGMTANGRAWRDALAVLGNSDHYESVKLADDLRTEITKVLPVLLKYAQPSQYQKNSKKRMKPFFKIKNTFVTPATDVQLNAVPDQLEIINRVIALLNMKNTDVPYANSLNAAWNITLERKEQLIRDLLFEMQHFDTAPAEFNHIRYSADLLVSEANWHQLLRHNRKTDFTFSNPNPFFGITIPPRIVEAGLTHLLKDIAGKSKELYNKLVDNGLEKEAEYVVLNAHKRLIHADFSLTEAYHLINLRTSEEAQWDIRETFEELFKQLYTVHPLLISQAKRRL